MNEYAEIQSIEWYGGILYFRNPKLRNMVRYKAPFSDDGIIIDGVPKEVLDVAYRVAVFPKIQHISYKRKYSDKIYTAELNL